MTIINTAEFVSWPKIPREQGETITITEKLDGTNACIVIEDKVITGIQSRKRMLTVGSKTDNAGFAGWVHENEDELLKLGEGRHFGEWVGQSIQKNPYHLDEKRFYLFNTFRWNNPNLPECCHVVPVLYEGEYNKDEVETIFEDLKDSGSRIGGKQDTYQGYVEGIIVYYGKTRRYTKDTYEYRQGKHGSR